MAWALPEVTMESIGAIIAKGTDWENVTRCSRNEPLPMAADPATNTLSRRVVETGRVSSSGLLITDGLKAGEWIVVAGTSSLSDGQEVKIVDSGVATQ